MHFIVSYISSHSVFAFTVVKFLWEYIALPNKLAFQALRSTEIADTMGNTHTVSEYETNM